MDIIKFRIWNYKSIVDSQDCYPARGVTILAGKNEAGKTSILEALEDFNSNVNIREKAVPIQNDENKPRIGVWFAVSKDDLNNIFQKIGHVFEIKDDLIEIYLEKNYPNSYSIDDESAKKLGITERTNIDTTALNEEAKPALDTIAAIFNTHAGHLQTFTPPVFDANNPSDTKAAFEKLKNDIEPIKSNIPEPDGNALPENIDKIIALCQKTLNGVSSKDKFTNEFKNNLPNFILFSSFNDIFPNEVLFSDLEKNDWIRDLGIISDLNISIVNSTNNRKKVDHKTKLNIELNDEFKKFWEQDLSKLHIDWDNEKLYFWIEEDGYHYEPEIRSQGRRWHLAFYIRITARARENYRNVILIDEPGLYLHAKAQRDILNKLEEASNDAPIIFSTHSPYLIEADKLERIRLVQKTSTKGTVVENKIHKVADKETLTPILTAIGLEMSDGITQLDKLNNVIVEGPSDYYFLQALKRLLKVTDINFIYGGGCGNMPKVGTILQGWGCNVVYLYDTDQGFKDAQKNIKAEWITTTKEMIEKIPVEGAIEDIFSQSDYVNLVIVDSKIKLKGKNSEHAKSAKRDKVLDSKLFLESIKGDSVQLDKISTQNSIKLLDELKKKFIAP